MPIEKILLFVNLPTKQASKFCLLSILLSFLLGGKKAPDERIMLLLLLHYYSYVNTISLILIKQNSTEIFFLNCVF